MKIGFNEGCNQFCKDHSVLKDLELCEKHGFDFIDIQSECLDRDLAEGKYTLRNWHLGSMIQIISSGCYPTMLSSFLI